jgi:hypothetical protein
MPFRPALAWQRHRLRWPARLARRRTANPVAQPVEPCSASFTPPPAPIFCRQATAATASAKPSRTARRGQIPIATRTAGCPTHRDFVPWRFSDAGRQSEGIVMSRPASENLHRSRHRLITSDNVILFESCQRDVPKSPGARAAAMLSAGKQSVHQSIYRWEEHHEST